MEQLKFSTDHYSLGSKDVPCESSQIMKYSIAVLLSSLVLILLFSLLNWSCNGSDLLSFLLMLSVVVYSISSFFSDIMLFISKNIRITSY